MQFDQTSIAVRERGMLEIMDLSLHVIRHHFRPLLIMWLVGVVPMMLLNHFMIGGLLDRVDFDGSYYFGELGTEVRYFNYIMTILVIVEAPLATLFMSQYLGNAVFQYRPSLRSQIFSVLKLWWPIVVSQLLIRGVGFFWFLAIFVTTSSDLDGLSFFVTMLLLYHFALRAARPYINEIILLERNPMSSRNPNEVTISKRSARLHSAGGSGSGLVFGRTTLAAILGTLLTYAVYGALMFFNGVMWNDWEHGAILTNIGYPLALWTVIGFLGVVRFLCYLDTRIRFEGWEVELRFRAEAERMRGKVSASR